MNCLVQEKQIEYESEFNPFEFEVRETVATYGKEQLIPYFYDQAHAVKLFKGNCLEILKKFPPECVDMIFADPPYKLSNGGVTCHSGKMVSVNKGEWDRSEGLERDHDFNLAWLKECQRLLKPDATIFVSGTLHVIYSIGFAMQQLGFRILNDIAWYKPNAAPNLSCRYFTHSHEIILWASVDKKARHKFNYREMKELNGGKQMRSLWEIPTSPPKEKIFGKHPTQKPLKLMHRIIKASTLEGDLVLDPFTGSSSTGVAAVELNRKFIGIDNNQDYLDLSIKRIKGATRDPKLSLK